MSACRLGRSRRRAATINNPARSPRRCWRFRILGAQQGRGGIRNQHHANQRQRPLGIRRRRGRCSGFFFLWPARFDKNRSFGNFRITRQRQWLKGLQGRGGDHLRRCHRRRRQGARRLSPFHHQRGGGSQGNDQPERRLP
jgi:hypothetical protein